MNNKFIDYYSLETLKFIKIREKLALIARKKMYSKFIKWISKQGYTISKELKVLDVGVSPQTNLLDSNFFEQIYPYKNSLVCTSIEDASYLTKLYPGLRFIQTSPYSLPFKENEFDVLFCNAVLEHVGNTEMQTKFVSELLRVTKTFCIITPNKYYPIDFHTGIVFLHWFPSLFRWYLKKKNNILAEEKNLNLLSRNEMLTLFPNEIFIECDYVRMFGLISNLMVFGRKNI